MSLTAAQQQAIAARGNVLVMAGAGTGKTSTLVARCLDCLSGPDGASLEELLVVTFTEAAAAEARERIRTALEAKYDQTREEHWARQLALFDVAHIGTLHSFCFKLIRQHFYQLGLDPQVTVLDEGQARLLANETLTELLDQHYAAQTPRSAAIRDLIETYAAGRDESIRRLVLQIHNYGQTQPDPQNWLLRQVTMFSADQPTQWAAWLLAGIEEWRGVWLTQLDALRGVNPKAAECADILRALLVGFDRQQAAMCFERIIAAKNGIWPKGKKTELKKPLEDFFEDVAFLATLSPTVSPDPLLEDWNWCRPPMLALLQLAQEFTARFTERKHSDGLVDFHDLEQLALQLLWQVRPVTGVMGQPSVIAQHWRKRLRFVFVDEYQDINAAQDQIIAALSGEGPEANRFLVGDIKQSIYRFRLAEPGIFRAYARDWKDPVGRSIALAENFRSRPAILEFANAVFAPLMGEAIGGVNYDAAARLIPGLAGIPVTDEPEVEMCFQFTQRHSGEAEDGDGMENLQDAEKEARHVALRLQQIHASGREIFDRETGKLRTVAWRDMAVLLRAPSNKSEGYAKQFARVGVPLAVERGGFFETLEVADLLNLLRLLDNPLQDVPLLAVLRSPLVGLSLDELAGIRLAGKGHFWTALVRSKALKTPALPPRAAQFLSRFAGWRKLARHAALSRCLDAILTETHYADWLRTRERGAQRYANVQRLLGLAEQFDQFQRQGLYRFLRFVEAQHDAGAEPEAAGAGAEDAVRLMSIHQSKGLEFPIVAVADLGKSFNLRDLGAEIILDEQYGLCPQVRPPQRGARFPSAVQWLARQRQRREALGEELRLLYVALTRAREKLLLTGSLSRKKWEEFASGTTLTSRNLLMARSAAEWLARWHWIHGDAARSHYSFAELDPARLLEIPQVAPAPTQNELPALDPATLERLQRTLSWEYPYVASTQRAAKTSVTALRRAASEALAEEAQQLFRPALRRPTPSGVTQQDIGNAHHKFLQYVTLASAGDAYGLRAEAQRLRDENVMSAQETTLLDFEALEQFWQSPVGVKIRGESGAVKRELEFTARFQPGELDAIIRREMPSSLVKAATEEFVIVQGVADLVVLRKDEIWLLDFKTDDVRKSDLAAKAQLYAPQLQLYAMALRRIYGRPVTQTWLHFLAAGETVGLRNVTKSK